MASVLGVFSSIPGWMLVVGGIGAYWLAILALRRFDVLPSFVGTQGPILTLHTKRFHQLLDQLAAPRRAWRAWGNFGIGVALVVMIGAFAFFAFAAAATLQNPPAQSAINQPRNVLVIPGVNDFLPLSVAPEILLGLAAGLVVHEGGHGIMCRVGEIEVESVGLAFLAFLPVGAFVEPDDDSRRRASRGDQTRMFAAGVINNFALTIVTFALLFGPVIGLIGVAPGAAIGGSLPGTTADSAGLRYGDRIISVNGTDIDDNDHLDRVLGNLEGSAVELTVHEGGETRTAVVDRDLVVTSVLQNTSFREPERPRTGWEMVAVNGTPVDTERAFREALEARTIARLETGGGNVTTGAVGMVALVQRDGPLDEAGVPGESWVTITRIRDERVFDAASLSSGLNGTLPGETVPVELYRDGVRDSYNVTLGESPDEADSGFLGVFVARGGAYGGLSVDEFGTQPYPADRYLRALGGSGAEGSFFGRILLALQLPLAGLAGALPYNFAGFTGGIGNFYTVTGALSPLAGLVFAFANVLFWTGWINLNLAVFNCIPAFPLDGGHILRTSTETVVSRLPIEGRRRLATTVTTSVGLLMLASLLLTLFGPQLLR